MSTKNTGEVRSPSKISNSRWVEWKKDLTKNWPMYAMFIPVLVYFFIFCYLPMQGVVIAFKDYNLRQGIWGSDWTLDNFAKLFGDPQAFNALRNTLAMAFLNLTIGFLFPVVFALILSEVKMQSVRKTIQSVSYMPNFVATVVIVTLMQQFFDEKGAITQFLVTVFGMEEKNLLAENSPGFWFVNMFADAWQGTGYAAIVFVSAISSVNGNLYEAAAMDGANRIQRMLKITLPCILPTIITMFTLKVGNVFKTGFDKIMLLYMPAANLEYADVLQSYIYRMSFEGKADYGLSAALGLFQSVVSTLLLIFSNKLSKKFSDSSLF